MQLVIHTPHPCYSPMSRFESAAACSLGWSASLAFAPVRRNVAKKLNAPPARLPAGVSVPGASTSTAAISSTAVIFAPPTTVEESKRVSTTEVPSAPVAQGWGKKVKPPSMVLDEDVNGFNTRRSGKKTGGKKSKKVRSLPVFFSQTFLQSLCISNALEQTCCCSSVMGP